MTNLKIVVLDALPLDAEGDMDWSPLREMGELILYPQTQPDETAGRIAGASAILTNKVRLTADYFANAPTIRLVSVLATGYDIVDVVAARNHGVTVCNVPGYSTPSTAQATIALLLELCHYAGDHAIRVREGGWTEANAWSFWLRSPVELAGKTLLIVGLGAVGRRVGRIAEAMGMQVFAAQLPGRETTGTADIPRVLLEEALPRADVISLHCPLTPETHGLMNTERLAQLKSGAFLINTARGALVEDAAIVAALESGHLGGYAADVLSIEPPLANHPLFSAPRCIVTPHSAWASHASRSRLLAESIENLRSFHAGLPRNVVS